MRGQLHRTAIPCDPYSHPILTLYYLHLITLIMLVINNLTNILPYSQTINNNKRSLFAHPLSSIYNQQSLSQFREGGKPAKHDRIRYHLQIKAIMCHILMQFRLYPSHIILILPKITHPLRLLMHQFQRLPLLPNPIYQMQLQCLLTLELPRKHYHIPLHMRITMTFFDNRHHTRGKEHLQLRLLRTKLTTPCHIDIIMRKSQHTPPSHRSSLHQTKSRNRQQCYPPQQVDKLKNIKPLILRLTIRQNLQIQSPTKHLRQRYRNKRSWSLMLLDLIELGVDMPNERFREGICLSV